MVTIEFLGPVKKESISLNVKNLKELKETLQKDEELKEWLKVCAIAINDKIVTSLDTTLKDGDKISILPPVCGG